MGLGNYLFLIFGPKECLEEFPIVFPICSRAQRGALWDGQGPAHWEGPDRAQGPLGQAPGPGTRPRAQVPNMRAARAQVPSMRIFGFGGNPCKTFPWEGLGEIGTPKGLLGTTQTIPLVKNLGKPRGGSIPPQSYAFRAGSGLSWAKMRGRSSQKWVVGSKI